MAPTISPTIKSQMMKITMPVGFPRSAFHVCRDEIVINGREEFPARPAHLAGNLPLARQLAFQRGTEPRGDAAGADPLAEPLGFGGYRR